MKSKLLLILLAGMVSATTASADSYNPYKKGSECPIGYEMQLDGTTPPNGFGPGTSDLTTCIAKKKDIRIVLNMSSDVNGPNGKNQVLNNATNMIANYENIWGIEMGDDLKFKIVAHFKGAKTLLDDPKYKAVVCPSDPDSCSNASLKAVKDLIAAGVHIYMCQTTMRANGWKTADLIEGVEEVPAGVIALVDFAQTGWAVITP